MRIFMVAMAAGLIITAGYLGAKEADAIKSLAGGDGPGQKSIIENVCEWCWPEKAAQYQQDRMDAQYERACRAAEVGQ